jgi:hypothetical protein
VTQTQCCCWVSWLGEMFWEWRAYSWARCRALASVAGALSAGGEGVGGSDHSEESSEDGEALHVDGVWSLFGGSEEDSWEAGG